MGGFNRVVTGVDGTLWPTTNRFVDFTGKTVGRLFVNGIISKTGRWYIYLCTCVCGNTKIVNHRDIRRGGTSSCGCLDKEHREEFVNKQRSHGLSLSPEYKALSRIKNRTSNPNCADYEVYSVLGMEESWKDDFYKFLDHIGNQPDTTNKWSIGRIDNDIGYFEGNVRWELDAQQARNKGKFRNNTSGVTGVYFRKESKYGKAGWTARWTNMQGQSKSASYSCHKYGEEMAFFLACEKRELEITKLNLLGEGYSDKHGK